MTGILAKRSQTSHMFKGFLGSGLISRDEDKRFTPRENIAYQIKRRLNLAFFGELLSVSIEIVEKVIDDIVATCLYIEFQTTLHDW